MDAYTSNRLKKEDMRTNNQAEKENAFPHIELNEYTGKPCNQHFGLTKRELFAAMAMQGILSSGEHRYGSTLNGLAQYAVQLSDALINELNKQNETD